MKYLLGPRRWHRRPFMRPIRPFYPRLGGYRGRRWLWGGLGCFPLLIVMTCLALVILARVR